MSASSVLGESWVVASVHAGKDDVTSKQSPRTPKQISRSITEDEDNHGSESITASTSSISGPELIMPSIYETPISEASWIAPAVRMKQTNPNLRRRHQPSAEPPRAKQTPASTPTQNAHSTTTSKDQTQSRLRLLETPIRTIANIILLAAISHLLLLPELVQQYQTMCSIGPISILYSSSCIARYPQPFSPHQQHHSTPFEPAISSQSRLESLFNTTLHDMAPFNGSLKQTESQLRTVERELKHAHPGTKHELDLEFKSCWRAIRIAAWKFDSLNVDLQSAVDSLVAAGDVKPRAAAADSGSSVAQDARLSTQMLRREQYLDQLTARMRSKADSLAADLATLDDHLESIEAIVNREMSHPHSSPTYLPKGSSQGPSNRLSAFVDAMVPPSINLPSYLRPREQRQKEENDNSSPSPEPTLSQIFQEATTHHRPVANSARTLSKQLQQFLQSKTTIPF
ncbi:hypothetical protein BDW59DRAFT_103218 [Aspergillus cavernicola]|uniref:Uncharacterized protein n=1 Tax=Aspergillus cavernicola TaxID=176166 RepID=A0ABR4I3M0_9EURO